MQDFRSNQKQSRENQTIKRFDIQQTTHHDKIISSGLDTGHRGSVTDIRRQSRTDRHSSPLLVQRLHTAPETLSPSDFYYLQRTIGNRTLQSYLAMENAAPPENFAEFRQNLLIQYKLN